MGTRRPVITITALVTLGALGAGAAAQDIPAQPIPQNPSEYDAVDKYEGAPATADPLNTFRVPQHPFMAPNGDSNLHEDPYQTDASVRSGPLGEDMEVTSTFQEGVCASVTFDREGRIITICVGIEGPKLMMFDPKTLDTKTSLALPPRSGGGTGNSIFNDFSGGGYFYLDHKDRAVIPTNTRQLWVVSVAETERGPLFEVARRYTLLPTVQPNEAIVSVLPDWNGRYWFATTRGLVGTIARSSGRVRAIRLEDELIANSFAVDRTGGVYVVSDHRMYRFDTTNRGAPKITWKTRYDRGERLKPGQASQGSGTTPTVIGRRYVAITDNADPRMHVLLYRRRKHLNDRRRIVCRVKVFRNRKSNTDQSLIAVGRSLITENNYGYTDPRATQDGRTTTPGLTRIHFSERGCRTVWESDEVAPSVVPKVSIANGLVYTYTKPKRRDGIDAWYLTAIDFHTGETIYKQLSGTGLGYNNNYAPITIGPDGSAYVGALGGLIRLADASN